MVRKFIILTLASIHDMHPLWNPLTQLSSFYCVCRP